MPVSFSDKRLNTVGVERMLLMADMTGKERKRLHDKFSAVINLQDYLYSEMK